MGNIIDYLKEYGDYSFLERPFSDEDALALAQFSYLKLEGAVPEPGAGRPWVTAGEIGRLKRREEIFADRRFAEENSALYDAMRHSRRFQTTKFGYYVNRIDRQEASQFAAVTCALEDGTFYIAFRGTDETLAGWREAFTMACRAPVKSQEMSAAYLNCAAAGTAGALTLGGHSKGGNLAVYAAMCCEESVRERIRLIYNFDGPGFLSALRESEAYRAVAGRVRKLIPHFSLVGMLLEASGAYSIVESNAFGIFQHDPFTWLIQDGKFKTVGDVNKGAKEAGEILNEWIGSLSTEEREDFIEALFMVLEASEAETLLDFSGNRGALRRMAARMRGMDRERRRELRQAVGMLAASMGRAFYEKGFPHKIKESE